MLRDRRPDSGTVSALRRIGLDVVHCDRQIHLRQAIEIFCGRVVLTYMSAGCKDGPGLYRMVWPTPVMVLAPKPTLDEVVEGLKAGAADYRSDGTDPLEIAARLRALARNWGANGASVRTCAGTNPEKCGSGVRATWSGNND